MRVWQWPRLPSWEVMAAGTTTAPTLPFHYFLMISKFDLNSKFWYMSLAFGRGSWAGFDFAFCLPRLLGGRGSILHLIVSVLFIVCDNHCLSAAGLESYAVKYHSSPFRFNNSLGRRDQSMRHFHLC